MPYIRILLLATFVLLGGVACTREQAPATPMVEVTPTSVAGQNETMLSITRPVVTASRSRPAATAITTPEPTPLPTVPPEDREAFVQQLYSSNAGCRLPCWWGTIPGVSAWSETERFLQTFVSEIIRSGLGRPIASYTAHLYIPDRENLERVYGSGYSVSDGTVISIHAGESPPHHYSLARLLTDYGTPDEVWIFTFRNTPDGSHPSQIVLIYSQQGIAAVYDRVDAIEQNGTLLICPEQAPRVLLHLVHPNERITFEQLKISNHLVSEELPYLPLVLATDLTVDDFSTTLRNTDANECIETPLDLWP